MESTILSNNTGSGVGCTTTAGSKVKVKSIKYYTHKITKWLENTTKSNNSLDKENQNPPSSKGVTTEEDVTCIAKSAPDLSSSPHNNHYNNGTLINSNLNLLNPAFDDSIKYCQPQTRHNNTKTTNMPNVQNSQNNYHTSKFSQEDRNNNSREQQTNHKYNSASDNYSSSSLTTETSTGSSSAYSTTGSCKNSSNNSKPQKQTLSPEILIVFNKDRKMNGYYLNLEETRAQQEKIFIHNQRVPNPNYHHTTNQNNGFGRKIEVSPRSPTNNNYQRVPYPVFESSSAPMNINYGRINTVDLDEYYARGDNNQRNKNL